MPGPRYFPILMRTEGLPVLVVGGGGVAEAKTRAMLDCGARVRVVAIEATAILREWVADRRIEWESRAFEDNDLAYCQLAFCATNDPDLNRRVSDAAKRRGIPVNVVDVPELCTFIVPSILRRGHLAVAVSTDGLCPSFSRHVRRELESAIDESYGRALELLEVVRAEVYAVFRDRDYDTRRRVMEAVLALDIPAIIRTNGVESASSAARDVVRRLAAEYAV